MVDDYDFVLDQLDEYYRSVLNLARLSPEDRTNEIEYLGRSFKELSKLNFPELDDKDHDPFTGTMYSISTMIHKMREMNITNGMKTKKLNCL